MILRSLSAPDAEKFYTLMCTAAGRELPREAFAQALAQALEQTGRRIVLVCASGLRAAQAASELAERGYTDLAILAASSS